MQTDMRINEERFKIEFETLAEIGLSNEGGMNRMTFNEAHLQARAWFQERVLEAGLDFKIDQVGNHSGIYSCNISDAPTFLVGSHLDSVPNGGKFDGALGVLSALEVVRTIKEAGIELPFHLEAIDLTDEEGTWLGLFGSSALTGNLAQDRIENPKGGREAFSAALARAGLDAGQLTAAKRDPHSLAGYIEVHIEQSARLTSAEKNIGIISSIAGIASYALTYLGKADHAGTTSMSERLDAGLGAAKFNLAARELVMSEFPGCVVNVGKVELQPGAFNIVPQRADLTLEFRAPEAKTLAKMKRALLELGQECADEFGLGFEHAPRGYIAPAPMSADIQQAFASACEALSLSHQPLYSGAGHDAQSFASVCPAGMIFIPSTGGSHNPAEFAAWADCVNGANVLLHTVAVLAEIGQGGE